MTGPSRSSDTKHPTRAGEARSVHGSFAGFTLLEMMVVIVIVGILSALAVPSFLRTNAEAQLEGEAQRMLLNFRLAKMAANKTGYRHFLVVTPPRAVAVWRTKSESDITFDAAVDSMVFRDSLSPQCRFGFGSTAIIPSSPPPGVDSSAPPSTASDGLGVASKSTEDCWDNKKFPTEGLNADKGWAYQSGGKYVIPVCGGPTADLAMGTAYFSTARSPNRFYALTYAANTIQLRLFRWRGAQWEEM